MAFGKTLKLPSDLDFNFYSALNLKSAMGVVNAATFATQGNGTDANPWEGWERVFDNHNVVYFPEGKYRSSGFTVNHEVCILGDGFGRETRTRIELTKRMCIEGSSGSHLRGGKISGLTLYGDGLYLAHVDHFLIDHVYITGAVTDGIRMDCCWGGQIINCYIAWSQRFGIYLNDDTNGIWISGCGIYNNNASNGDNSQVAIWEGCDQNFLFGNYLESSNEGRFIWLYKAVENHIIGNYLHGAKSPNGNGIHIRDKGTVYNRGNIIIGNHITGCAGYGVYITDTANAQNNIITSNLLTDNASGAINDTTNQVYANNVVT